MAGEGEVQVARSFARLMAELADAQSSHATVFTERQRLGTSESSGTGGNIESSSSRSSSSSSGCIRRNMNDTQPQPQEHFVFESSDSEPGSQGMLPPIRAVHGELPTQATHSALETEPTQSSSGMLETEAEQLVPQEISEEMSPIKMHERKKCIPCAWMEMTGSCRAGSACMFCHSPHNEDKIQRPGRDIRLQCKKTLSETMARYPDEDEQQVWAIQELLAGQSPFLRMYTCKFLGDHAVDRRQKKSDEPDMLPLVPGMCHAGTFRYKKW
eukprot:TRINITY_DN8606_c1_g1_i1.p1 TRINITY_DN8606_c1_g1~~TRINITY_DN8606_c1_g1_i1.p1  ORF type:complete len:270 (+),score=44.72 TRINITY_DN8606_c1_g1_i1:173-982(+)